MKTCEEMTRDVFRRIGEQESERRKRREKRKILLYAAASLCCVCLVMFAGIGVWKSGILSGKGNVSCGDTNYARMLFTTARVVEIYSPRSLLVEVVEEDKSAAPEDHTFAAGDTVRADFREDIVLHFVPGDLVVIGRGCTGQVDYTEKPYVAVCNTIRPAAEEDYRNLRIMAEDGDGAADAGWKFAERGYGAYFENLPEDHRFRITDYQLLSYSPIEASETSVSAEFTVAVKAVEEASYAGQSPVNGTGDYAGWLILRKRFTLEYRNNGYWNCVKLENVEMS